MMTIEIIWGPGALREALGPHPLDEEMWEVDEIARKYQMGCLLDMFSPAVTHDPLPAYYRGIKLQGD